MHRDVDLAARAYETEHGLHIEAHRLLIRIVNGIHEMGGEADPVRLAKLIEPAEKFVMENCHLCGGAGQVSMNGHGMVRCPECKVVNA